MQRDLIVPLVVVIIGFLTSHTDALAAGGSITNGGNYTGSLSRGQIDQWTFTANEGDAIVVSVSETGKNTNFIPSVEVRAPDRTSMGIDYRDLWAVVRFHAPQSGTYTVQVSRFGGGTAGNDGVGQYVLALAQAPGTFIVPSGDEGGQMTNGSTYTGSVLRGDLDLWTFAASQGDPVTVSVSEVGPNTSFIPAVEVFGPDGKSAGVDYRDLFAKVSFTAPLTGAYTAVVSRFGGGTAGNDGVGQYSIALTRDTSQLAEPVAAPTPTPGPAVTVAPPALPNAAPPPVVSAPPPPQQDVAPPPAANTEPPPTAPGPIPSDSVALPDTLSDSVRADILTAVDRANDGWANALQTLDSSTLGDSVAGELLRVDLAEIAQLRSQGVTQNNINTEFVVADVMLDAPGHGLVQTHETWYSQISVAATGQPVKQTPSTTYVEMYTVEYLNGGWIVTRDDVRPE